MPISPPKQDVAQALLERGSLFVYLDPRREGVRVPPWLSKQPQLVLQVGLDLPIPIPDLRVDEAGVFGTLSFNRAPFTCDVPWDAVYGMFGDDGMGYVWQEELPEEIAAEVAASVKDQRPALRTIEGGASEGPSAEAGGPEEDDAEARTDARKRAPHLRLVK